MRGVNRVIIIGNLGNDPDMKYAASGSAVANISVATSESWVDKQTGEKVTRTEWHRAVFFNRLAEVVGEYLKKGSQVYIEGKLQTRKWQDKDGIDRYTTEIVGREMQILGSKQDSQQAPQSQSSQGQGQGGRRPSNQAEPAGSMDDQIPF